MIFIKNPRLGKVKTRLASSIGDEKALHIYQILLDHTHKISRRVNCDKAVFYSEYVNNQDEWKTDNFQQYLQNGDDLGSRMSNAFIEGFNKGYKKIVIIGSDCLELDEKHLTDALALLTTNDVVLGPARDGGYYLLGMRRFFPELFQNKKWSSENVLLDTLLDLSNLNLSFKLLPTLNDIDTISDLKNYPHLLEI